MKNLSYYLAHTTIYAATALCKRLTISERKI